MGAHEYGSIGVWEASVVSRQPSAVRNYPNPFSDYTTFEYEVYTSGPVTLTIFNHLGQKVDVIVNELKDKGKYMVYWNAERLQAGVYFIRLTTGNQSSTGKMVVMK
jgi:hypothetical protein